MTAIESLLEERGAAKERGGDDRPRILIASRDTGARRWAPRWLESSGFRVEVVNGAGEALDRVESDPPDLVAVDVALRDSSGNSACETLLTSGTTRIPVLALCARAREVDEALDAGATEVLIHPFNWQVAARRADALIRSFGANTELEEARRRLSVLEQEVEDERKRVQRETSSDPLTGLLTRSGFESVLRSTMGWAPAVRRAVVVMLFDLDRFKRLNGTFGRPAANTVLQQAAQRLSAALRSESIHGEVTGSLISAIARAEGDLFAVLLSGVDPDTNVPALARIFQDAIAGEYRVGNEDVRLSASGSAAVSPRDGSTAEELIQSAEHALEEAKGRGGGALCVHENLDRPVSARSARVRTLLVSALRRNELELHYQPLVEPDLTGIRGAEALLRWNNPELGSVSPGEFVPLAEETGLMAEIGTWVLRTACRQLREWLDRGLPPLTMCVNVSLCQMTRGDLPTLVRRILDETEVPASLLELEISERGNLRDDPEILDQLFALKKMGVRLAVDDFGTGNSAIAYIKRFPFDTLKIDQSFVQGVLESPHDAAITGATVAMAQQLDLTIVAEGVEQQDQADFLREHGCSRFQGFLFSPAVPASRFEELLAAQGGVNREVEP
jgi:diguanylate cyclase (GGDEF)-like protein